MGPILSRVNSMTRANRDKFASGPISRYCMRISECIVCADPIDGIRHMDGLLCGCAIELHFICQSIILSFRSSRSIRLPFGNRHPCMITSNQKSDEIVLQLPNHAFEWISVVTCFIVSISAWLSATRRRFRLDYPSPQSISAVILRAASPFCRGDLPGRSIVNPHAPLEWTGQGWISMRYQWTQLSGSLNKPTKSDWLLIVIGYDVSWKDRMFVGPSRRFSLRPQKIRHLDTVRHDCLSPYG
jgi:hypothetical protein